MILYKFDPDQSQAHNIIGYEYIIETDTQFVSISAVNDIVHSIEIDDKDSGNEAQKQETRMVLAECYEVIAFAKDIRAVVGKKIYRLKRESEVEYYASNKKTI